MKHDPCDADFKKSVDGIATATSATERGDEAVSVARIATIAVATPESEKTESSELGSQTEGSSTFATPATGKGENEAGTVAPVAVANPTGHFFTEPVIVLSIQDAVSHARQGKVAQLYSETLQESILVVGSEALASRAKSGAGVTWVVYALSELRSLKGMSKDSLRSLHALKKEFNGTLGMPTPIERARPGPPCTPRVRCVDCAHLKRVDRPHMGRCAAGNSRHWLWDTDKRQCEDFEAAGGAVDPEQALDVKHNADQPR